MALTITRGSTPTFQFSAKSAGVAFDLTGAAFQTQIRGPAGLIKTFADGQHTAAPDHTANRGKYTLSLSVDDTTALAVAEGLEIVTRVTQGSSVTFFRAKILTVLSPSPDPIE